MRTRPLGSSGPQVSTVGFGTWAIGGPYEWGWGPVDDEDSIAAIRYAIEEGVNWIDTAAVYGLGHSEEVVSLALRPWKVGDEVFVFTKCGRAFNEETKEIRFDLRPETMRAECDASLRRLGLERLDLYQLHWPDTETGTPIEESWGTMIELAAEGKVRWVGVSNFNVELLERCEAIHHVDSLQPPLSLIKRGSRSEVIPWCHRNGTGVVAYAPMRNGLLTGKFDRASIGQLAADDWRRRSADFNEPNLSKNLALVEKLATMAGRLGTTLPTLSVAWALHVEGVTCAAVGARRPDQVDGWLSASNLELSEEALSEIETAIHETGAGDD